jgi:hypothetical protein
MFTPTIVAAGTANGAFMKNHPELQRKLLEFERARARRAARDVLVGLGLGPSPAIKIEAISWLLADVLYRAGAGDMPQDAVSQLAADFWVRCLECVTRISPEMSADLTEAAARVLLADVN